MAGQYEYNVSRPPRAFPKQPPAEFVNNHRVNERIEKAKPVRKLSLQAA